MSHYRVAGLSRFLKLGECVGVDVGGRVQIGEVVKIDDAFGDAEAVRRAQRRRPSARAPTAPKACRCRRIRRWKGRVVDALGRPLDGAGELAVGDRPAPLDADPPPALRRGRVSSADPHGGARRRPLHAALPRAARRRVRGLGRRQVVAAGHARPRAAVRHRRHRARRRAGPRSARVPRRHARRRTGRPRWRSSRPATKAR